MRSAGKGPSYIFSAVRQGLSRDVSISRIDRDRAVVTEPELAANGLGANQPIIIDGLELRQQDGRLDGIEIPVLTHRKVEDVVQLTFVRIDSLSVVHGPLFPPGRGKLVAKQEVVERHDHNARLALTGRSIDEVDHVLQRPCGEAGIVCRVRPKDLLARLTTA